MKLKQEVRREKSTKPKADSFEKIDKLARLTNKKRHKLLVEMKGAIITNFVDIRRIKRSMINSIPADMIT